MNDLHLTHLIVYILIFYKVLISLFKYENNYYNQLDKIKRNI